MSAVPLLLALCLAQGAPVPAARDDAERRDVAATVTSSAGGGLYLDVGGEQGVGAGARGTLSRDGVELAQVEVRHVSATSCFAVVVSAAHGFEPLPGDRVTLIGVPEAKTGEPRAPAGAQGKKPEKPFVPLLAPQERKPADQSGPVVHGSFSLSTSWLSDRDSDRDFLYHRVSTLGSAERLGGGSSPWSFEWSLDLSDRTGDGYDGDPDQDQWQPRADLLVLRRHFEDGSVVGLGRVEPLALPGLGRIDGAFGETTAGEGVRLGAIAGLRPDRDDLGFTAREPLVAGWSVVARELGGGARYSAAAGVLASWFEGSADQHALLADFFARTSGGHTLQLSAQGDLYSGDEPSRSGLGLTRLHAMAQARASQSVFVRALWSQYQNPDTEAEREDAPDDALYGRGRRRAALALVESFPRGTGLHFEEEVAQVNGSDSGADWQVTLRARQSRLFGISTVSGDLALFNLVGLDFDGLGASAGFSWFPAATLHARLGYDASRSEINGGDAFLSHTVSLWASYDPTARASLWLRVARSFGDELDTLAADVGLTWRF
jgi:hypothetical protein